MSDRPRVQALVRSAALVPAANAHGGGQSDSSNDRKLSAALKGKREESFAEPAWTANTP